ncbi:MAG: U32 family peptidase [Nitrospiraceae bacterium]|nr:MAG: U32 family peptidase [Nitrospiraceae bacterium]
MKIPELLAPAGSTEKLVAALHYGADAVYMGLSSFSLRARADNFTAEELEQAARLVRSRGKRVYITVNILAHPRDMGAVKDHLARLRTIGPDGLIVSDAGVFDLASEWAPGIPLHISTQANITNGEAARFWERLGARRLVLSRELSIAEIKEIRDRVTLELECFVHGSLCISYSGRCYMSSFMAHRSGNRGECTNACRWNYTLMEEKRPGVHYPVYENDRGTYVMSSRDLCMIEHLDELAGAGVDCFKIEGRMKGINYVAGVVKTYREAVDSLTRRPYEVSDHWLRELSQFSNRGFTTGMYLGNQPDSDYNNDEPAVYRMSHELVGIVLSVSNGTAEVALRNTLRKGESIEPLTPGLENHSFKVTELHSIQGVPIEAARNEERVLIPSVPGIRVNDLIRRRISPP